jgi:pyruvate,water dikinase
MSSPRRPKEDTVIYVVWFDDVTPALAPKLGGKCAALSELTAAGMPVPPGFAVTPDAYRAVVQPVRDRLRELVAQTSDDSEAAGAGAAIRELFETATVPDAVRDPVVAAYTQLCRRCGTADVPVAVRSSAVGEDALGTSFAGEHDTYLWVRGEAGVLRAVQNCWGSLFTDRAMAYRRRVIADSEDDDGDGGAMGVAIQQMVRADVAGVAFTLDPQNGDRSKIAIDASWGFGEAVVSGEVTPDNFLVDKVLEEITRRVVSDKAVEYRIATDGRGVVRTAVPADRRTVACLSDEQVTQVARLAGQAEQHYGHPQDVEWAIETGPAGARRVLLLQSRPETVWSRRPASPLSAGEAPGYDSIVATLSSGERATDTSREQARLPSPFEIATPSGAEGWEDLYTYSSLFSEGRRAYEEAMFWFQDGVHWPMALPLWDATFFEYAIATLSQYNTRHYLIPAALGIDTA